MCFCLRPVILRVLFVSPLLSVFAHHHNQDHFVCVWNNWHSVHSMLEITTVRSTGDGISILHPWSVHRYLALNHNPPGDRRPPVRALPGHQLQVLFFGLSPRTMILTRHTIRPDPHMAMFFVLSSVLLPSSSTPSISPDKLSKRLIRDQARSNKIHSHLDEGPDDQ